ncbi:hypothetical protein EYM_06330 [Ignicoccus islandicus DSM 13165]|uniref:Uncharacterized protein n=1 Tax=Ignicoccus islandicus DSM 13165 TaxID=940295 RepID=A0A0U3FS34_9CREN|nr:hypothetical protein [Ignicoccus islandicus]ALU12679.1 hypothetical protein EYM_06330 [Ignicoccus islandicus DSM 13165]
MAGLIALMMAIMAFFLTLGFSCFLMRIINKATSLALALVVALIVYYLIPI